MRIEVQSIRNRIKKKNRFTKSQNLLDFLFILSSTIYTGVGIFRQGLLLSIYKDVKPNLFNDTSPLVPLY